MTAPEVSVVAAVCKVLFAVEHIAVGAAVDEVGRLHIWPTVQALTSRQETSTLRAFASLSDSPLCWHAEVH
jgi:hypothetical protein